MATATVPSSAVVCPSRAAGAGAPARRVPGGCGESRSHSSPGRWHCQPCQESLGQSVKAPDLNQPGFSQETPSASPRCPPDPESDMKVETSPQIGPARTSSRSPHPLARAPSLLGNFRIPGGVQVRVRALCLPVLRLAGLFQGESLLLWSLIHLLCPLRPSHSHPAWHHLPASRWGHRDSRRRVLSHPRFLGLIPVCWRKKEMTAAFAVKIDFALY